MANINWKFVDKEWKDGYILLDRAVWYLLEIAPPVDGKNLKVHEENLGDFGSLRDALKTAGICTVEKRFRNAWIDQVANSAMGIDDPSTYEKIYSVSKEKLIKFYKENQDWGCPPFLFKDAREVVVAKSKVAISSKERQSFLTIIAILSKEAGMPLSRPAKFGKMIEERLAPKYGLKISANNAIEKIKEAVELLGKDHIR